MRTIKILTAGPIRTLKMVHGPILTPYKVDDNKLRSLLREGLDIVEILPNGIEKKLILSDLINSSTTEAPKVEPKAQPKKEYVKPEILENAPVAETAKEETSEELSEEPVVEESEERHQPRKNKNKK